MFADYREPLVEVAAQLLVVLLDHETIQQSGVTVNGTDAEHSFEVSCMRFALKSETSSPVMTDNHEGLWGTVRTQCLKWPCTNNIWIRFESWHINAFNMG